MANQSHVATRLLPVAATAIAANKVASCDWGFNLAKCMGGFFMDILEEESASCKVLSRYLSEFSDETETNDLLFYKINASTVG